MYCYKPRVRGALVIRELVVKWDEILQNIDDCDDCIVMCCVLLLLTRTILILLVLLHPSIVLLDYP